MSLIDDRGRLFGKLNLIDAAAGLFILVLIPLVYGAHRLFRVPVPTIESIQPRQVIEHETPRVRITGTDFRPFLSARIGMIEAPGFLVQSPTVAEIEVPALAAGTYDLALYDEGRELVRRSGALTVVPPPPTPVPPPPPAPPTPPAPPSAVVQTFGEFVGLSKGQLSLVRVGSRFEPMVEVLAVRGAEPGMQRVRVGSSIVPTPDPNSLRVPAIIRLRWVVAGGLLLQLIVLPYVAPFAHAGHGLIANLDAHGYHVTAVQQAERIRHEGWGAWRLIRDGLNDYVVALGSVLYLIYPEPWVMLPFNGVSFGIAVVAVRRVLVVICDSPAVALLALIPFFLFPSFILI